jgi:hypothetical protein
MHLFTVRQSFDRRHGGAGSLHGQHGAGFHGAAVDMHDAGAALAGVAADVGAGQAKFFAQELNEQSAALDLCRGALAVHRHFHGRHLSLPEFKRLRAPSLPSDRLFRSQTGLPSLCQQFNDCA